jgi:hypothetical protein
MMQSSKRHFPFYTRLFDIQLYYYRKNPFDSRDSHLSN